jgi:hypothetical protein
VDHSLPWWALFIFFILSTRMSRIVCKTTCSQSPWVPTFVTTAIFLLLFFGAVCLTPRCAGESRQLQQLYNVRSYRMGRARSCCLCCMVFNSLVKFGSGCLALLGALVMFAYVSHQVVELCLPRFSNMLYLCDTTLFQKDIL